MMNTNWTQNKVAGFSKPQLNQGIKNTAPGGATPNPMTQLLELAAKNKSVAPPPATPPTTTVAQDVESQSQQNQEQQQFQAALQMSPQVLAAALQAKQSQGLGGMPQQPQQPPQGLAGLAQPQPQPAAPETQAPVRHPLDKGVGGLDNGITEDSFAGGGIVAFAGGGDTEGRVNSTPEIEEAIADMARSQKMLESVKKYKDLDAIGAQEQVDIQAANLTRRLNALGLDILATPSRAMGPHGVSGDTGEGVPLKDIFMGGFKKRAPIPATVPPKSDTAPAAAVALETKTPAADPKSDAAPRAPKSDAAPRANRGPGIANTPRSKYDDIAARFPLMPVPEDLAPVAWPVPVATSPEEMQANDARSRVLSDVARNRVVVIDKEIENIRRGPAGPETAGAINNLLQQKAAILTGSLDEKNNNPAGIKTLLSDQSQADQEADMAARRARFRAAIGDNPQVAIAEARHKKAGEGIDTDEKNALDNAIRDFGFAMMADPGGQKSRGIGGALRGTLAAAARSAPAGLASWKATKADVQKRRADLGALEDQLAAAKRAEDIAVVQFGHTSQEAEKARQVTRETADKVERAHNRHTDMLAKAHFESNLTNQKHWDTMKAGQVDQNRKLDIQAKRWEMDDARQSVKDAETRVKDALAGADLKARDEAYQGYKDAKRYEDEVRRKHKMPVAPDMSMPGPATELDKGWSAPIRSK